MLFEAWALTATMTAPLTLGTLLVAISVTAVAERSRLPPNTKTGAIANAYRETPYDQSPPTRPLTTHISHRMLSAQS